ncbi:MAG: hypothetical protein AAFU85_23040 [Planctomycetota bacterium]
MKPKTAQRLASLVIDEWPMPRFIKRWIESHPDVARELKSTLELEQELRLEASPPVEGLKSLTSKPALPSGGARPWLAPTLAIAATVLLLLGGWQWRQTRLASEQQRVEKLKPVLASVNASQTVARSVSSGAQRLLGRFTYAANEFTGTTRFGSQPTEAQTEDE